MVQDETKATEKLAWIQLFTAYDNLKSARNTLDNAKDELKRLIDERVD